MAIKTTKRLLAALAILGVLAGSVGAIKTSHPHHSAASWSSPIPA